MNDTSNYSAGSTVVFRLFAACLSDKGKERECNEDAIAFLLEEDFFAIADGMGGYVEGAETANAVATIIPSIIKDIRKQPGQGAVPKEAAKLLADRIIHLSNDIAEKGNGGKSQIFGSTLTSAWFIDRFVVVANMGDSRAYLLNKDGDFRQITKDHSLIELLLEEGEITQEEADRHPACGQLTRFVGMSPPALPEIFIVPVNTGDKILLCSDGLNSMVSNENIIKLMNSEGTLEQTCEILIEQANRNGGKDNISVVIIEVGTEL